ncbi:MAG: helix-turn-helix domain-containing protein [Ruminococcus sp.]|nr:helix-turn-helix domain-containing protein [Ruminococcus sp.]
MTFWDVFSKLCNEIGKKPNPVGKEIGVSSAAIANWKTGSIPNGETLMKIADYFHVSVDYLLGRADESTTSREENNHIQPNLSDLSKVANTKPDGVTTEFLKAFETLDFSDKLDTMNFVRDRMRKV